ncbi:hypothetical protein [Streptomyces panaciradicis]|uniref:hypothetical protein n=1 Tax=Streptomyces panaciradicis TaxID=1470261 RepID=UPI00201CD19B|nr:hypothetical protein [Streptomyces panaciradicis]MCL6669232.1 hypothetical protein [Streptomyces panaciradicis]
MGWLTETASVRDFLQHLVDDAVVSTGGVASGVEHGVLIPDAADPSVKTLRVVARR